MARISESSFSGGTISHLSQCFLINGKKAAQANEGN